MIENKKNETEKINPDAQQKDSKTEQNKDPKKKGEVNSEEETIVADEESDEPGEKSNREIKTPVSEETN